MLSVQFGATGAVFARTQPFTRSEVIASIRSTQPLIDLAGSIHAPRQQALAGEINSTALKRLFSRDGTTVLQIGLANGADPLKVVRDLDALPFVTWASPNFIYNAPGSPDPRDYVPNNPLYPQQYHHPLMKSDLAWDFTLGDPHVIIAITDDGLDTTHEDLYQNVWINQDKIPPSRLKNLVDVDGDGLITFKDLNDPINQGPFKITGRNPGRIDALDLLRPMDRDAQGNDLGTGGWATGQDTTGDGYIDDLVGWSTIDHTNDPNPRTGYSHGTHVGGIAAAMTDSGVGVAGTAGNATIMPIRFYDNGAWTSAVIAESYAFAADHGARIMSTSYNVDQFVNDPVFASALDYMYAAGVLHFNSAGNNGQENPPRAQFDQSLYVVATDINDHKASYSNYGYNVDISAPGDAILSTFPNNTYGLDSGTSMSTPNTAGVAALIWSLHPDWTREQVAAQLLGTADNIDALNLTQCGGSCAGKLGAGRVDSFRALTEQLAPPRFRAVLGLPDEGQSTMNQITTFQVDVANVFDAATVADANNWEIREAGPDGIFDTNDDVVIHLRPLNDFQVGTNRLFFQLDAPLPPGLYQFRAYAGGLTDPFGTPLDGNDSGKGGDNFIRNFSVLDGGGAPGVGGHSRRLAPGAVDARLNTLATVLAADHLGLTATRWVSDSIPAKAAVSTDLHDIALWSAAPIKKDNQGTGDARISQPQRLAALSNVGDAIRWDLMED